MPQGGEEELSLNHRVCQYYAYLSERPGAFAWTDLFSNQRRIP